MATAISTAVGVVLGLLAGYFGGWLDMLIMRFTDMVMSFPYILLVLVAAALLLGVVFLLPTLLGFALVGVGAILVWTFFRNFFIRW